MGNDIAKIDSMISVLRNMKADLNRLSKLSAMDFRDMTPKQCQKRAADADWIGMENIKRRHELHALAVELNFAERRESYHEIELTDGWHRFNYKPREPN
ncbi:regulator [Pectobacterium sp. B1J-3]|uniref:regulator n=1 Tax=Pectobacterium sp. B1J-3 TaxID=3385371 RepID=UPI00390695FB